MKKIGCLVIFLVIGVVAWLTNPSEQEHIDNAYEVMQEKGIKDFGIDANYLAIGQGLIGKDQMDNLIRSFIKRKNYYLFSLTQIELMGEKHYVALGLFGRMWTVGSL